MVSKRLVDLSEAFDIMDWNVLLLNSGKFIRISAITLDDFKQFKYWGGCGDTQDQVLMARNRNPFPAS